MNALKKFWNFLTEKRQQEPKIISPVPTEEPLDHEATNASPVSEDTSKSSAKSTEKLWEYLVDIQRDKAHCSDNTTLYYRYRSNTKPGDGMLPDGLEPILDWYSQVQKGTEPTKYPDVLRVDLGDEVLLLRRDVIVNITCKGWKEISS